MATRIIAIAGIIVVVLLVAGVILYTSSRWRAVETPATVTPTPTTVTPPASPVVRIATSPLGTTGYVIGAYLSDIWNRETRLKTFVQPYASTDAGIKALILGDADIAYAADVHLIDIYSWGKEFAIFTGLEGVAKKLPVQTVWLYTMETFFVIRAEDAGKFKCWSDLAGKPVFLTPVGFGNHLNMLRALKVLGIKVNHVEISTATVADALEKGTIVASALYTTGQEVLPPWGRELDLKAKLAALNPCPEEVEKFRKAGLVVVEINGSKVFFNNKDIGIIKGVAFFFGWHAGIDLSEDYVYEMLVALEKVAKDYAGLAREFKQIAEDFVRFQVTAIESCIAYGIPVHPGLAKFLKERGAWNPAWDKYIAKELIPRIG